MKFFKWLKERGGKVALSALQTAGLATVVGVTGVGVYNFLGSSGDSTPDASSTYNPGDVVYVAGAPSQGGTSGITGGDGMGSDSTGNEPNRSSFRVTTRTLDRLNQAEERERITREMEEYGTPDYSSPESYSDNVPTGSGYQGGATEGLGMNSNLANAMGGGDDPMAAVSGMMGNMQGMISQVQGQVQGAASSGKAEGNADNGGSGGSDGKSGGVNGLKNVSLPTVGRGGNGSGTGSTYVIQNSNKNKGGIGSDGGAGGDSFAAAQAQINAVNEKINLANGASGRRSGGWGNNNSSNISNTRRFGYRTNEDNPGMNNIKWIAKRSNKAALTSTRASNEGNRAFFATESVSGGMHFDRDNYVTGGDQSTKDYDVGTDASLSGLGSWGNNMDNLNDQRDEDRNNMKKWFWIALGVSVAATIAIPFIKRIPIWGKIAALALAAIASAFCIIGFIKALTYAKTWGKSGFSTVAMVGTGLLVAAVWVSFFLSKSAAQPLQKQAETPLFGSGGFV